MLCISWTAARRVCNWLDNLLLAGLLIIVQVGSLVGTSGGSSKSLSHEFVAVVEGLRSLKHFFAWIQVGSDLT